MGNKKNTSNKHCTILNTELFNIGQTIGIVIRRGITENRKVKLKVNLK